MITQAQIAYAIDTWWQGTDPDGVMAEDVEALKADLLALFPQPTREQVRTAIDDAFQHCGHMLLPLTDYEVTSLVETAGDAVLALIQQPTPSAKPCTAMMDEDRSPDRPIYVHRCERTGEHDRHRSSTGAKWADAEPVSIDDMAPEHSYEAMRTDIISALYEDGFSHIESEQLLRRFESTIRDVTPPKEA